MGSIKGYLAKMRTLQNKIGSGLPIAVQAQKQDTAGRRNNGKAEIRGLCYCPEWVLEVRGGWDARCAILDIQSKPVTLFLRNRSKTLQNFLERRTKAHRDTLIL